MIYINFFWFWNFNSSINQNTKNTEMAKKASSKKTTPKPAAKYTEASIGRVSIHDERRGEGIGKKLLVMGIKKGKETYGTGSFRISAQEYLISYYESHGFKVQGNPYDEDGIPHVEMLLDE